MSKRTKIATLVSGLIGISGFSLGVATQNGPDETQANLKAWLKLTGVENVPSTVLGLPLDTAGLVVAALFVGVSLIWFFWPEKPTSKFLGYMTPYEVIMHLSNSTAWGAKVRAWRGYSEFRGAANRGAKERHGRGVR
ncbi:hypothetical protein [Brevundimonas sp.]|uniref:hypothetical protein n=1 Tax=Brevundimonas sp. TaxID=1871086 RepID=UPI003D6D70C8